MAETDSRSTKQLFADWQKGDAGAGQIMAQRFADWYYAITTSRLGETRGRAPCDASCAKFSEGIATVRDGRTLVGWAHDIVLKELAPLGARADDGDEPNAFTGEKSPKDLLVRARTALPTEVKLLEASYSGKASADDVEKLAEPLGGNPIGILRARYRVKQWLRDQEGVPFEVAPESPILDRAPLPLYESGRMATQQEEVNFEQWMIDDIDLCRDIAEFAHFSIALRGGLPTGDPKSSSARSKLSSPPTSERRGCLAKLFGG